MALALNPAYPLLDLFWTMLMALGLAVLLWTIVVVFRDLFSRADIGAGMKTLWVLAVVVFPIAGSLVYLISQSTAMAERRLVSRGDSDLRMDAYLHTASGGGNYRGVRDLSRASASWSGPGREA